MRSCICNHRILIRVFCALSLALAIGSPAAPPPVPVSKQTKPVASREKPFENGLGMKFVPVANTRVFFSIWETRNQDYAAWVKDLALPGDALSRLQQKPTYPVANVSWDEAAAFCRWLTDKDRRAGLIGSTDRYRLPTDKEWDAAVGPDRYPWGKKWPTLAERAKLPGYKPVDGDNLAPVGSFAPNPFGIFDLGGNVLEWCHDWYRKDMNPTEVLRADERLDDDGGGKKYKVLRGASWVFFDPVNLLSAYRYANKPEARGGLYGFRCVLEPGR